MIISSVTEVATHDVERWAWSQLGHMENVDYVTERVMALHNLPEKQRRNAQKQAQQIRFSLRQAREYFDAAGSVSAATRPVLLYYCAMSLALAEILFKQTGDSRLEKLRENHGAHGLTLALSSTPKLSDPFQTSGAALWAKPQITSAGRRWGTFEVWRQSSREPPLCGLVTERHGTGNTSGIKALLVGEDKAPPHIPDKGINLLDCVVRLPSLRHQLAMLGISIELVRATVTADKRHGETAVDLTLTVHPGPSDVIEKFSEQIIFSREAINHIKIEEFPSGYQVKVKLDRDDRQLIQMPYCITTNGKIAYFSSRKELLNEFGFYYLALHICGNYARYHPDAWLPNIESRTPLCLVVEALCDAAMRRLPILALSELRQMLFLVKDGD